MSTDVLVIAGANQALVPSPLRFDDSLSVEGMIGAWLHAKGQRSHSARTVEEYAEVLGDFRAELARAGLDLDAGDVRTLGMLAQAWAARPRARDGRPVSGATHNRRLAILSSFYTYAKRHGLLTSAGEPLSNPVELVERARVQAYAGARPLDAVDVAARLVAIDRSARDGMRDYALLAIAVSTGRRLSELAALRWRHVTLSQGRATITWERVKGGKQMHDRLPAAVTDALLTWLYAGYGPEAATLAPDAPLWLGLGRNVKGRQPLSTDAIADLCKRHLGTSKVHTTRHTFAVAMEQAGAKLTDIQARLGHANAATTGIYLNALKAADNAYANDVAALFGIGQPARTTRPLARRTQHSRPAAS